MRSVVILGLDGLDPALLRRRAAQMPNLKSMQEGGIWGTLLPTVPAAGSPAWTTALSGRNPAAFGFWADTCRDDASYGEPTRVDSTLIDARVDWLPRILPRLGQKVALVNVPGTWPPPHIPGGYCVSPAPQPPLTWPQELAAELQALVGDYAPDLDLTTATTLSAEEALRHLRAIDAQRLALAQHFASERRCDLVCAVLRGPTSAPRLSCELPGALHDYYAWLDGQIGALRQGLDGDAVLFIVSAYTVARLEGRVHLNEWLVERGYLTLQAYPPQPAPLASLQVDWARTRAWALGDTGRLYINLRGREAEGTVDPADYDRLLDELAEGLRQIAAPQGGTLEARVVRRDETHFGDYAEYGPDLLVDWARWANDECVGYGPGAVLAPGPVAGCQSPGYFCLAGAGLPAKGELSGASLLQVAPTVLELLRLPVPAEMEAPSLLSLSEQPASPSATKDAAREAAVRSRLEALGY